MEFGHYREVWDEPLPSGNGSPTDFVRITCRSLTKWRFFCDFLLDRFAGNRLVCAFVSMRDSSNLPLRLDLQDLQ